MLKTTLVFLASLMTIANAQAITIDTPTSSEALTQELLNFQDPSLANNTRVRGIADLMAAGKRQEANMAIARLLAKNPKDKEALELAGISLMQMKDFKAAEESFRRLVALPPVKPPVVTRYGVTKMLNGDTAGGAKLLLQVVSYIPDDNLANRYLGWMMYRNQQYDAAAFYLGKLPPPSDVGLQSYHIELSRSFNHLEAHPQLVKLLEPMYRDAKIPAAENSSAAALYLTLAYAGIGDQAKASKLASALRAEIASTPSSVFGLDMGLAQINKDVAAGNKALKVLIDKVPSAEAAGRLEMAKLYLKNEDIVAAIGEFETALSLAPEAGAKEILSVMIPALLDESMISDALNVMQSVSDKYPENSELLFGLADLQTTSGMRSKAQETVKQLLAKTPPYAPAYLLGASLAQADGQTNLAKSYLEKHVAEVPTKPEGWISLARFYVEQNNLDLALTTLQKGIGSNPGDSGLRFELGSIHEVRGELDQATQEYTKTLELNPDHLQAMDNLASNLLDMNVKVEKAREYATILYQQWPDDPYIEDLMGWAFYRTGDLKNANIKLSSAAAKMTESGRADYHLGLTLKDMGDTRSAKSRITSAIEKGLPPAQEREAQSVLSSLN